MTLFLLTMDEQRFDASCESFTEGYLDTFNHLKLASLLKKKHLDAWSMLLWLLGWSTLPWPMFPAATADASYRS